VIDQCIRLDKPELPPPPQDITEAQARKTWIAETWVRILRTFIGREDLPKDGCEVVEEITPRRPQASAATRPAKSA